MSLAVISEFILYLITLFAWKAFAIHVEEALVFMSRSLLMHSKSIRKYLEYINRLMRKMNTETKTNYSITKMPNMIQTPA